MQAEKGGPTCQGFVSLCKLYAPVESVKGHPITTSGKCCYNFDLHNQNGNFCYLKVIRKKHEPCYD